MAVAQKNIDDLNDLAVRFPELDTREYAMVTELEGLHLPTEDGIPMETNWHRLAMNLLLESLHAHWRDRTDYFAGGNMFVYFSMDQVRRKHYRGPDVFVVTNVDGARDRESWIVWQEEGRYPDVIIELASPSTIQNDLGMKKTLYEQTFRTAEYFCYDPVGNEQWGWRLHESQYHEIPPNARGWQWSQTLQLWLGAWNGEFQRLQARWPRFYTEQHDLVLTFAETEARYVERERQRAEAEARRAEAERIRADEAERRAERLAAKLLALGVAETA